ncbi:T9SS type A sorting domain-containing protein [Hymenobacter terrestris]|uniref:T9SS type A sorting domain-containing protein n=1 Tax=Hymenobacter terrestris TaxID=2748310 RepID=A0ABX2Q3R6_9BACT|nr:T9SS type A sorting domain-containing protein [Hymenobacter terrestris]NVO85613.1 T9SS type A sorting domain-containing protein [Hymenobacter terrestris]
MKQHFTLAALGLLTAASFSAQAQAPIVIDGKLTATEVVASGYQLVGRETGPRGFGDAGLLAVYAAADATNLYFFVAGTLETNPDLKNSIQMFIDRPGVEGIPVGTALPVPAGVGTPPVNTSFEKMGAKLDLAADLALGLSGTGTANQGRVEAVVYSTGPNAANATVATGATPLNITTGAPYTVPVTTTGTFAPFAGATVAYVTSPKLSENPGFASNGNAPANGFEIRVSRLAMGVPATGGAIRIFVLQNSQDGGFASSDFIPQATSPAGSNAPNLGPNPDFTAIAGTQAATLNVTATGLSVVTSTQSAIASALKFGVYPNPTAGAATVSYTVPGQQEVSVEVFNALGQRVRSLASGRQGGLQQQTLSDLASGAYFVKLQVGGQSTSQKLIVQ